MTLADLRTLIRKAKWFENIGSAPSCDGRLVLRSIHDWDKRSGWDWLPNGSDQMDAFHTDDFNARVTAEEKDIFRETLKSLRRLPVSVPGLVSLPHDFTQAARNGAAFAARMAAREIVLSYPDQWQKIMRLFEEGFWPCGRTENDEIVVL